MVQILCFNFSLNPLEFLRKTSPKEFSTSKYDEGNWILSKSYKCFEKFLENFWIFLGIVWEFFGNCLGIVWELFGNFLGGFFGVIFLE